jgi:hypothetical protein
MRRKQLFCVSPVSILFTPFLFPKGNGPPERQLALSPAAGEKLPVASGMGTAEKKGNNLSSPGIG